MPFVTDILGPRRPLQPTSLPAAGGLRRTSTIDTHPAERRGSVVDLRARDAVVVGEGSVEVLGVDVLGVDVLGETLREVRVEAHLTDFVIDHIDCTPAAGGLDALRGRRVGRGFRSVVHELLPDEVARASLLHSLLDDWVGASLVSGYATQYAAITLGVEQKMPPGVADRMAGICAGFAPEASLIGYAREHDVIPTGRGPEAPPLAGLHDVAPLRPRGMRRFRRLDTWPAGSESAGFEAHFRDSHVDDDSVETIVHEYTVTGAVETATRTITSVSAEVRVLPWQECPGAIGSATRIRGMNLRELRDRVRGEFVGTSTCTHLNDTLRAVADLDALLDLGAR